MPLNTLSSHSHCPTLLSLQMRLLKINATNNLLGQKRIGMSIYVTLPNSMLWMG